MTTTITGRKVNLKDSFRQRCEKKLQKIAKFFEDDAQANVTVTVEKALQTVEITVKSKGVIFRAEHGSQDMEDALDVAVDAIVRKIRKNKTKIEKRMKTALPTDFDPGTPAVEEEYDFKIVRSKKFAIEEHDIDEAILKMNMLGHQFFLFKNSATGQMNVVYKRHQGDYGLIEPEI